jgi:hypothetical protein
MDRSRFLITGLPRSRTAWLAALMCAHGVETLHEYPPFFANLEELRAWLYAGTEAAPHGYVDGFAIIHHAELVRQHFAEQPIVVIWRNPLEVRASWESREEPLTDANFQRVIGKVMQFWSEIKEHPNVLTVPYALLDDYAAVNEMVIYLTGQPLKLMTFRLFHQLKIELLKPGKP